MSKPTADEIDRFDLDLYRLRERAASYAERNPNWRNVERYLTKARSCTYAMLSPTRQEMFKPARRF